MRLRTLALTVFLLFTAAPLQAQTTGGDLPPLIDRAKFFGDPQYSSAQIAPDGELISFKKTYKGEMNVWVKETDAPFEDAWPVTADTTRPIPGHAWTQDGEEILFFQDRGGNENYHVYAVDPRAEAKPQTGVPPARDLTPYEDTRASIISVPEATPNEIIVGMNDRNPRVFDPYRVNVETGERELILQNDRNVAGWTADLDGHLRLATRQTSTGGTEILQVTGNSLGEVVYSCSFEESCGPVRFHKDGERVYMTTNKGAPDLTRLVLFNPDTQEAELIASDPKGEVDFGGAEFSEDDELAATYYIGDRLRYEPKTEQFEEDLETLHEELPDGEITFGSSTEDESRQIVRVSSDVDPGSTYLYDREAGGVELLYRSRPDLPSQHLAPMQAIRYEARSDGTEIPAYLTLPKGVDHDNLPIVVNPHGGPWSRDTWGYDGYAQFLANRGYGVLQVNFRGSTGYGQEFLNAGNDEWGDLIQDDITDGVRYLVDAGIADPERVGIFGGSYGGYATLAGLAFTPDVYAAGISYVGPSNIITLLNAIPPYWGPVKKTFDLRVGDPNDPEDRKRLKRQSPLFSADEIEAPLMVIQGANDPRVAKRESDQIVAALRDRGQPVEYLVAESEGHGFHSRENRLAVAAAMERFLADHLGGRYQQQMSADLRRKLASLTVDPASVTLPDSLDRARASAAKTASLPDMDGSVIEPGTMQYQSKIELRGREVTTDKERTIKEVRLEGEPVWRVIETAQSKAGASTDTFDLSRETLRPLRRGAGGQGAIQLRYTDDAVTGVIRGGRHTVPIDVPLEAPVLSGGAGLAVSLAGLPLKPDYDTTVRLFSVQRQAVQPMRLTVTGTATTETKAGSFDTYEVELTPLEGNRGGGTFYVRQTAPHYVVRSEQPLPAQMGGGTITTKLVSM